jgi:hypothetical protein
MDRITGPIAAIIVALIITLGILVGSGSLTPAPDTYATVSFDGGYKKIGVISQEKVFTKAEITLNGRRIKSGDFDDIIEWMTEQAAETGGLEKSSWKAGVAMSADAGVEWLGSESKFQLATESIKLVSTVEKPLMNTEVVSQLKALEQRAKASRQKNAEEALQFGPAPKESFLLTKVLSALSK